MSITRLPEIVFPLTQVNKVNEIVDVLNENLNMYYSAENPALTPVEGVCTWTVTHNLGTENVNCSLYNGDNLVISNVSITSENVVTVSLNSDVAIAEGTYKIVIISNGAGSSSGSGSYVLPTASTTTLGGVRIDGSSITINNGVISSTVDSTLSSASTNPVQNKVLTSALDEKLDKDNFIPARTIINVNVDGSGDFATIQDAINFLTDKWSSGEVVIFLGEGTYNFSEVISINCRYFNFTTLIIKGSGIDKTIIEGNNIFDIQSAGSQVVEVRELTLKGSGISGNFNCLLCANYDSNVRLVSIKVSDNYNGIISQKNAKVYCYNITIDNCINGILATGGFLTASDTYINISQTTNGIKSTNAGRIFLSNVNVTSSSVSTLYSPSINTLSENGFIIKG